MRRHTSTVEANKKKSVSHYTLACPLGTARLEKRREVDRLAAFVRRSLREKISAESICVS